jgi:acyl carrier protein
MCYARLVFASFSPVFPSIMDRVALRTQIKELIIRELNLEGKTPAELDDDAPLFGSGLGLDSLDALQLAMAIEERYKVTLPEGDEVRPIFASVAALADFVARSTPPATTTA